MNKITAVREAMAPPAEGIATLKDAKDKFGFTHVQCEQFFPEWRTGLAEITTVERSDLDILRRRYLYHREHGDLLEGTVTLLLVSPLLSIAGFYDPPFRIKAEPSVELVIDDGEEVLRGQIDVLILQDRFWVIVLESKKTTLSAWAALPQALSYLMANPLPNKPVFGLLTNGDDILFIKVTQNTTPQYSTSRIFAPFIDSQELYTVLQIIKSISQRVLSES
jgi:hypothetical protein